MSRRFRAVVVSGLLVAGVALVGAPSAAADVQLGLGHHTSPAQPYLNNPDPSDWIGSYVVGGKQVFCVQFAHLAPDSNELYQPGAPLKTKWGTDLPPDVAANISYLLLRYGDTKSADEAAALAHLLHTWTASPQNPSQLDPSNDFQHIAYDAPFHLTKLPAGAQAAVQALTTDATTNRGPWTATVIAPNAPMTIGGTADWGVSVKNAAGKGVPTVPVTVSAVDATFTDPATGKQVTTGVVPTSSADPLVLKVTATGASPKLDIELASPAEVPVVQQAVEINTQRIVSTGGEKKLTATARTSASPPPTTTTPPQPPTAIPAGAPGAPGAQAEMDTELSGGAVAGIAGVLVFGLLAMWQLILRRRERRV